MRALFRHFALSLCGLVAPFCAADILNTPEWRRYAAESPGHSPFRAKAASSERHRPYSAVAASTRTRIVARAHELIGQPYKWGGASLETGFDCSGLLVYLYRSVADLRLPRTTRAMIAQRDSAISRHELQPGDAVFFSHNGSSRVSHVGLYIGDNRFIHAPRTGKAIRINSLEEAYWHRAYVTARSFGG
ncbi:C40 family peptidase [Pseudomonas citronellolis]|uniref:C40 family peptidase n=1 Tax=Pseudomonas citronellolis TaxID=53408 RepID=UPI00248E1B83|nr:C40 family peptidase [Pseudomonas citronellolis]